jgi:phosphatidylserine/phosphatidylglycerophosphate/cardiolipin synthase-like enzyme
MSCLRSVLSEARSNVMISSPWIVADTMQSHGIFAAISQATSRGSTVSVYTDEYFGESNPARTMAAREALTEAGAIVHMIAGLHAKLLTRDDNLYIAGSLNWLSAHASGRFARIEESVVYGGSAVGPEIEATWKHIRTKIVG